jgi:hypothetical protein
LHHRCFQDQFLHLPQLSLHATFLITCDSIISG